MEDKHWIDGVDQYTVGQMVWIDGVDVNNNNTIYYECKIAAVLNDCYVIEAIEDNINSPEHKEVIMFFQIDEIGLIT